MLRIQGNDLNQYQPSLHISSIHLKVSFNKNEVSNLGEHKTGSDDFMMHKQTFSDIATVINC